MLRTFLQSALLLCLLGGAALGQAVAPVPSDLPGSRRSGFATPELAPAEPKAPPAPSIATPAPAAPPATPPLSTAPIFVLRRIVIEGNTILDQPALDAVAAPYV